MIKEIVIHVCNEILFGNKNKWTPDTHNDMAVSQNNYAEYKQTDLKEYILYCPIYIKF